MRLPRNTKPLRGPLDAVPFISVLFLLVLFFLLHSSMVFIPGVPIDLPQAAGFEGIKGPKLVMAVDRKGGYYFENQMLPEEKLKERLQAAARRQQDGGEPLTLIVQADKATHYETLVKIATLAREVGISRTLWATRPELKPRPTSRRF